MGVPIAHGSSLVKRNLTKALPEDFASRVCGFGDLSSHTYRGSEEVGYVSDGLRLLLLG